jgi:type IV pilus assembly protein PilP
MSPTKPRLSLRRVLFASSWVLAVALAGCGSPPPPPPPPTLPPPKPVEVKPETPTSADGAEPFVYAYSAVGKRDPFHNPIDDLTGTEGVPSNNPNCSQPLCKWDLDQLKLVGIVTGMSNPVAMVEDPQGVGHLVKRNAFMGKKGGRVTQIKRDEVVVTEIARGGDGRPHPSNIEIKIGNEDAAIENADLLQSDSGD